MVISLAAMATTISASQFKARCLKLMDQVAASGETLVTHQERAARG
jgi:hypothetical protein